MYILINLDKMCIGYKHSNSTILSNLMHIEFPHCSAIVMPADMEECYNRFSELEMKLLYTNMCGQKFEGHGKQNIIRNVIALCELVPESVVDGFEVATQAASILRTDMNYYSYAPGCKVPKLHQDLFTPKALVTVGVYVPTQYTAPSPQTAPATAPQAAAAPKAPPASAPRNHTPAPSAKVPAGGSITDQIFAKAEEMWNATDKSVNPIVLKALRKKIVEALVASGVNENSAGKGTLMWQKTKIN